MDSIFFMATHTLVYIARFYIILMDGNKYRKSVQKILDFHLERSKGDQKELIIKR